MARLRLLFISLGLVLFGWAVALAGGPWGADIPRYVAWLLAGWCIYVAAVRVALALPPTRVPSDLVVIMVIGIAMRVAVLGSSPSLSDDVFRSIWDARVLHAGVNPYSYPPSAEELRVYRDEAIWPRVNAPEQRTPYPPLTEVLGAVAYKLAPEQPIAFQALAALCDVAAALLLAALLSRLGLDPRRSVVVAWSPIGMVQFAHSGHNDAAMVAGLVAACLALTAGRRATSMVALAAAAMTKVVPVLAAPVFLRITGWRGALTAIASCVLIALPFASAGPAALTGLLEEGREARFNESARLVVDRVGGALFGSSGDQVAGVVSLAMVAFAALFLARRANSPRESCLAALRTLGIYLLVSAVVQPWYTTWVAPLTAILLERGRWGSFKVNDGVVWLWLGGAVTLSELSYWPGYGGAWPMIRAVEYVPVYGTLVWIWWARRRSRHAASPSSDG